jgi:putative PEP-CTERM system TPR-repeat lipoprotein
MKTSHRHSSGSKRSFMRRLAGNKRLLLPAVLVFFAGLGGAAYFLARGHASPEERIANAVKMEQAGDSKGATIELKNALQKVPDNAEARFLLGRIHYANNDFVNAEKELRQAISKGYKSPDATILLARTLLILRQPKKVLDEINALPGAAADTNATILALRGHAYLLTGDKESAGNSLRKADELVPEHPDTLAVRAGQAYTSGQPEQALALVDKAIAKADKRVDLLVMKGDLLRALKRGEDAFGAYTKALTMDPSNLPARLAVAQHYLAASDLDKAQAELKTLNTIAPNNLMGRYLEGLIEFRRKNLDAANNKMEEVLRNAPDFAPANLLAGAILLSQGKRENAITHLNRVLDVAPDNTLARKLLATAMLESGQAERAHELIANIKSDDGDAQLLSLQGNIALRQGSYQEARQKLEKASKLAPDNTALIRELAASRMASGDESGAVEALTELAEKDTTTHQADVLLVMTHVKAKRYDEALKVVDELDRRQPGLPLAENLRGTIYLLRNDPVQARQHYTKALAIDSGYLPAASNLARLDLMNKDIKSARSRFQSVLQKDPNNARAMVALAQLAALEKNDSEFLGLLEQAKKVAPSDATAWKLSTRYWLGKHDAGRALVEAKSALDATGKTEFLDSIGAAQLLQNDTANALATYTKWAANNPTNPFASYRLALVQNLTKDRTEALKSLDKALALYPGFTDASIAKAILLSQEGKSEEGIKIARALQTRAPNSAGGYMAEAEIQFAAKKYLDAGRLFAKSAQIAGQGQPLIRANQAYAAAGKEAEGENLLEKWLKTHPDDQALRHALAQDQLNGKRLKEAADNYRILVRANPRDLVAYNNLAWILGELKDPQALAISEQALKLAPRNSAVLDTYGWQLALSGQAKRGIPYLRDALQLSPDNSDIRWHLAQTLNKAGDRQGAIAELDRLLTSRTAFPQATEARALLEQLRAIGK